MQATRARLAVVWLLAATSSAWGEEPYQVEWFRQLGTSSVDGSYDVVTDAAGNVFITGCTRGSMGGPNAGGVDGFVAKCSAGGVLNWVRQLGTPQTDWSYDMAADSTGHIVIAGYTTGSLGGENAGDYDAYVAKYDTTGALSWLRQLGSSAKELCGAITTDPADNVILAGSTFGSINGPNMGNRDAFLAKYTADSDQMWTRQMGTSEGDAGFSVTSDRIGNLFVTGFTAGSLAGPNAGADDAFIAKYEPGGELAWTRQLGTSGTDSGNAITTDSGGNVFITGNTTGSLGGPNNGDADSFVAKYDTLGNLLWSRQLGTEMHETTFGIVTDAAGNVFITGYTEGSLAGASAGGRDVFVAKYDAGGNFGWALQFGSDGGDIGYDMTADRWGNLLVTGPYASSGSFYESDWGDAFVVKLAVPEPGTVGLVVLASVGLRRRRVPACATTIGLALTLAACANQGTYSWPPRSACDRITIADQQTEGHAKIPTWDAPPPEHYDLRDHHDHGRHHRQCD